MLFKRLICQVDKTDSLLDPSTVICSHSYILHLVNLLVYAIKNLSHIMMLVCIDIQSRIIRLTALIFKQEEKSKKFVLFSIVPTV